MAWLADYQDGMDLTNFAEIICECCWSVNERRAMVNKEFSFAVDLDWTTPGKEYPVVADLANTRRIVPYVSTPSSYVWYERYILGQIQDRIAHVTSGLVPSLSNTGGSRRLYWRKTRTGSDVYSSVADLLGAGSYGTSWLEMQHPTDITPWLQIKESIDLLVYPYCIYDGVFTGDVSVYEGVDLDAADSWAEMLADAPTSDTKTSVAYEVAVVPTSVYLSEGNPSVSYSIDTSWMLGALVEGFARCEWSASASLSVGESVTDGTNTWTFGPGAEYDGETKSCGTDYPNVGGTTSVALSLSSGFPPGNPFAASIGSVWARIAEVSAFTEIAPGVDTTYG